MRLPYFLATAVLSALSAVPLAALPQSETSRLFPQIVDLPPLAQREVLGKWKIVVPMVDVTRTIERAGGKYYMVSRLVDADGSRSGGTTGLELWRISATEYHIASPGRAIYRINEKGELLMFAPGETEPSMRATPHDSLWP